MENRKNLILFWISVCCFFLMSALFLIMPLNFATKQTKIIDLLIGVSFWVLMFAGIATQIVLAQIRKKWFIRNRVRRYPFTKTIGVFSFLKNLPGSIADGVLVVSIIGLIVAVFATDGMGYACYVFVALLVFSLCMHCIFNGNIYYFLTNQDEILQNVKSKHSEKEKS